MRAEIALGRRVAAGIDVQRVVRASLHTALAANTALMVEVDDSVGAPVEGFGRTDGNAGGRIAVVTSHHAEMAAGVGGLAFLYVLHPGAKHAQRNLVLFLACHGAGMTANTSVLIDYKAVAHEGSFLIVLEGGCAHASP